MTYASDRLYNEEIRKNLARYSSTVKVREILPHLPCLTLTDREDVEAKRDTAGNYAAVQLLLDNLRRRENWPDEFIAALRNCEHAKLADEISVAYDRIRGRTNNAAAAPISAPAPPTDSTAAATATVTATVHTVPVTTPPLLTPPSVNAPVQSAAPSNITAHVPSPASVPQIPQTQRVEQVNVPTPAPSPVPASQAEIAPAVSSQASPPTVVSPSNVTSAVQQNEVSSHIGAPENKTPILATPDGQTTTSFTDASVLSTLSAQASSSNTAQSQTTNSCSTSEKSQMALPVKETSEKLPVQESNPPLNKERFQRPEECSDPTANEIVRRTNTVGMPVKAQTTSTAQATPSAHAEVPPQCSPSISQEYFSKPGILQAAQEDDMQEEPCSTVSSDLEISRTPEPSAEPGQSASLEHPGESLFSSNESSNAPLSHNLPEEDHYESVCVSHTERLTNVIHFAEEPSVENLNGRPPSMMGNTANTGGVSANLQHSMKNQPALNYENTENAVYLCRPSGRDVIGPSDHERSTSEQREEGQGIGQITTLHLTVAAAAAAVGVGLFLVWKVKH